jgi:cytochrome P450
MACSRCIGSPISWRACARTRRCWLEAEIALGRILARARSLEVDESRIVRRRVVNLRGLERLPLRLTR